MPIELVGPNHAVQLFGVRLVGFDATTGRKLLLTIGAILAVYAVTKLLHAVAGRFTGENRHASFVANQSIALVFGIFLVILLVSIWFNDPRRFASAATLLTAGLAIAMQKFVMSIVGYFSILRGNTFKVGDRIIMSGVRGDVIALGYIRTTILEMGEPPAVQDADPAMWIHSRQYTGRIVTVTNDKIFDEPVYNFSREFPFLMEEIRIPIKYGADRRRAESILLEAAKKHTEPIVKLSEEDANELMRRYFVDRIELGPRVYYRLTDNWIELTVRIVVTTRHIRGIKDAIYRDILAAFEEANLEIASSTFEVVGVPPIKVLSAES